MEDYGLVSLELVRDARQKRFMKAAQRRMKTGQSPTNWPSDSGAPPTRCTSQQTPSRQRSSSSRPTTAPAEPRLADTLGRCLNQQCSPPASLLPCSHVRSSSRSSKAIRTACTAHLCGLPQWHVHSKDNLLDMDTQQALPLTSSHSKGKLSVNNLWESQQRQHSHSSMCSGQMIQAALAPRKQLIDQHTQDYEAWVYCSIEQARETSSLAVPSRGLTCLPPQMMRFLLAEGRNLCKLDLSRNLLVSPPPWELLTSLQHVNVSHNQLESLGSTLQLLTQLRELLVDHNNLTNLPQALGTLNGLMHLSASHNKLEVLPASVSALVCLQKLEVSYNQLQALPSGLGCLHHLETLVASHNQLTGLPPSICHCRSLRTLHSEGNLLSAIPTSIGGLFSSLQDLQLHNNHLTVLPRELAMLTALTHLTLDDNPLQIPPPEVTAAGVQAVRAYLSTYTCTKSITILQSSSSDQSVTAPDPSGALHDALEEQGEQLLHLQVERDTLQHRNLVLLKRLEQANQQLAVAEQQVSELIRQHQSEGSKDRDSLPSTKDAVELGRMVHQLQMELRRCRSITEDHKRRADEAEEALQAERRRRLQAEEAAAVVKPSVQQLQVLQQKVDAGAKRAEGLEQLVANHLFQQCAAEQRCWEAEAKLDMLELGKLAAWIQEVQRLRTDMQAALHSKQEVEAQAAQTKHDLVATLGVLQRQLNALQEERECMWQADKLVQKVKLPSQMAV